MNPTQRSSGFALLLHGDLVVSRYEQSVLKPENRILYSQLRSTLSPHDPSCYRGISRSPIEALPSFDAALLREFHNSEIERRAKWRMREILGFPEDDSSPDHLLPSLAAAREVQRLLDTPEHYEIVHLSRAVGAGPSRILGFDVGYWFGEHYSILADAAVTPLWHPPGPSSFIALREALSSLNLHFLFATVEAARTYRDFYLCQPWAETESSPGEFEVITVSSV